MLIENFISIIILRRCTRLLFQIRSLSLNLVISDLMNGFILALPNSVLITVIGKSRRAVSDKFRVENDIICKQKFNDIQFCLFQQRCFSLMCFSRSDNLSMKLSIKQIVSGHKLYGQGKKCHIDNG